MILKFNNKKQFYNKLTVKQIINSFINNKQFNNIKIISNKNRKNHKVFLQKSNSLIQLKMFIIIKIV